MTAPIRPKIYHIIHVDRLASVLADGCLYSDAVLVNRQGTGTVIGMNRIKARRLNELTLTSHPGLHVGECVPFYFCPRSVMLYLIWRGNDPDVDYRGGQGPIIHLEADLQAAVDWAVQGMRRWAFTLSNAGSYYFEDRSSLNDLDAIDWDAVSATKWAGPGIGSSEKHGKQAEFLVEHHVPWHLVDRIGVSSMDIAHAFRLRPPAITIVRRSRLGRTGTIEVEVTVMIDFKTGDILKTDAEALVNTVNCVGIMGRGVALQFKNAFPANFKAYKAACDRQQVQPGRMFVYETGFVDNPKYIINFPTKRHWKGKSRLEDIEAGLVALVKVLKRHQIHTVAMPPLGSGLGGLHWPVVRRAIQAALKDLPGIAVTVFEPRESVSEDSPVPAPRVPNMTPGRAALVSLMRRYLDGLLDPFVTLLEVHKLMYFMQEAGEPLRLKYVKAPYGPYAENLRHVLTSIDGYFLAGYGDGGENPGKELTIVPGAAEDAEAFLRDHDNVQARFNRVADLVQGFETPFGLELLATVHWVMTNESAITADEVVDAVYAWSDRKKRFTPRQIRLAHETLLTKEWKNS